MKKIAVIISHYTIDNSQSIINILEFLRHNSQVDLYYSKVTHRAILNEMKSITVIRIDSKLAKWLYRLSRKKYDTHICFDPRGFRLCKELFPDSRPVYYSLELYIKDDHFGLDYPEWLMNWERTNIKFISGLIIQSEEKRELFQKDYKLNASIPTYILPVTCKGDAVSYKSNYLYERYDIPKHKNIALHLGGIASWFSCKEIAREFVNSEDWVVFFHGFPAREYYKEMVAEFSGKRNVILSGENLGSIPELDKIVSSCKVGIAWYNDISVGFRTAGQSSGKIATYTKFGLPIIAKSYPSTIKAIAEVRAGVCVGDVTDIVAALRVIFADYNDYSQAVLREYENNYQFEKYIDSLRNFLDA